MLVSTFQQGLPDNNPLFEALAINPLETLHKMFQHITKFQNLEESKSKGLEKLKEVKKENPPQSSFLKINNDSFQNLERKPIPDTNQRFLAPWIGDD